MVFVLKRGPGAWFSIKMKSYQYRKSHFGDKTILRPSYLHNGIPYIGKITSLYWIRALITIGHPWILGMPGYYPHYDILCFCHNNQLYIQLSAVIMRSNLSRYCHWHFNDSSRTYIRLQTHNSTTYLALRGDLWGVHCERSGENWPRYNGTALYVLLSLLITLHVTYKHSPKTLHSLSSWVSYGVPFVNS